MLRTIREVFVSNLRRLRGDRTQGEIAALAGMKVGKYKNAEYGKIPQSKNLTAIAEALGVAETALFLDPDLVREPTPEQALERLRKLIQEKQDGSK